MPTTAKYVDFRRVKAAVPIDRVLSHYGVWKSFTGSGVQRRGPCPIHSGANKRQFNVNLDKGAWYCFGDCRRGGNVIELVAELEYCNIREAAPSAERRPSASREGRMRKIHDLNDAFRATFEGGRVFVTASVAALPSDVQAVALRRVATFDDFTPENDPYGEHDFGTFDLAGRRFFWKIDYYDTNLEYGSPDPGDPEQTTRVLTLMLAEDY